MVLVDAIGVFRPEATLPLLKREDADELIVVATPADRGVDRAALARVGAVKREMEGVEGGPASDEEDDMVEVRERIGGRAEGVALPEGVGARLDDDDGAAGGIVSTSHRYGKNEGKSRESRVQHFELESTRRVTRKADVTTEPREGPRNIETMLK